MDIQIDSRIFLKLLLCTCALLWSSCIPVSSPAFVYRLSPVSVLPEECVPVVLVDRASQSDEVAENNAGEYLGMQFVLGIIPLTRLYSLEPIETLVEKELTSSLAESGFCVYRTSIEKAAGIQTMLDASAVIRIASVSASASAFDLIFVRRLSVGGSFELRVSTTDGNEQVVPIRFERGEFSKSGYGVELVALLREGVREALVDQPHTLYSRSVFSKKQRARTIDTTCTRSAVASDQSEALFAAPPFISPGVVDEYPVLEGDFASGLARIGWQIEIRSRVARGMASALASEKYVWSEMDVVPPCEMWRLSLAITKITPIENGISLRSTVRLSHGKNTLRVAHCEAHSGEAQHVHSAIPLLQLEQLTHDTVEKFYFSKSDSLRELSSLGRVSCRWSS